MSASRGITLFIILLFVGIFYTHKALTDRQLEGGQLNYYQPNYDNIEKNDFLMWSKEGVLEGYLKVLGLTKTGVPIVQYGNANEELASLFESSIYKIHENIESESILLDEVYPNDEFFDDHLVIFENFDYNIITDAYYTEAYTFRYFNSGPPKGVWSIMNSPYAYFIIVGVLVLLILLLKGLDRLVNSHLSKKYRQLPVLLIIGFISYRFLLGGMAAFFFRDSPIIAQIVSVLPYLVALFIYLLLRKWYEKQNFGVRQALIVLMLLVIGPFIQAVVWFAASNTYSDKMVEGFSDNYAITISSYLLSNNAYMFIACGLFLANLIIEYFKLRNSSDQVEKSEKKVLASTAELEALQSRVNPHFLYNSLNSIAALAPVDADKTEEMAIALSEFYRYCTNRSDELQHFVSAEMQIVDAYIKVESIRFGDRISFSKSLQDDFRNRIIPKFIIQPLVENAVKYGYSSEFDKTIIKVEILKEEGRMKIRVHDSGVPFGDDLNPRYGLGSISKKLKLVFGRNAEMTFHTEPSKFVEISILNDEQ